MHALVFSQDAVGLEARLHAEFAEQRVNKVNRHREFFRTTPVQVRDALTRFAGNHLLEFVEPAEALEWRASGAPDAAAPPSPAPVEVAPPSEDLDPSVSSDRPVTTPQLSNGRCLPLGARVTVRLVLGADGASDELDPVAFLLTDRGEVRGDGDMVFYGQPDHESGAVVLAADEAGASSALHLAPSRLPDGVVEVLLAAQVSADGGLARHADVLELDSGRHFGRIALPSPGASGLLQLGALQRSSDGTRILQLQAEALWRDLADLARAAGVEVA